VVTGTLISGAVEKEQETEVYPAGRLLRVRGVEVHGAKTERAVAGQRTALNLADIEPAASRAATCFPNPAAFTPSATSVPAGIVAVSQALKHRAPVHFHAARRRSKPPCGCSAPPRCGRAKPLMRG